MADEPDGAPAAPPAAPPTGPPPKTHELVTTAQVERTYTVQASTEEQARDRLRTHFKDADLLREGVVTEQPEKQSDTTTQRIKSINGKAVKEAGVVESPPRAPRSPRKPAGAAS